MQTVKNIDEFISNYPKDVQIILERIRETIRDAVPDLGEKISYGIPTFTLNGKNLVHFSAYEHHVGFYPGSWAIAYFADKLKDYETSKGTIRFPIDKPLPYDLIKEITNTVSKQKNTKK